MTFKREAAFHEAGHAVLAYFSAFHALAGPISLGDYGAGEIFVGMMGPKLAAAGLEAKPETARKPEVVRDLGVILVAGYVAETIAAERDSSLTPNRTCAEPDHALLVQQLGNAGLSKKFDNLEVDARGRLIERWNIVAALADWLLDRGEAEAAEVNAFIKSHFP